MTTDRLYLMAGSIAPRLNETLPKTATVLETDLDTDREGVHVHVQVGKVVHYAFIEEKTITSYIDRSMVLGSNNWNSPHKVLSISAFMLDTAWAQFACDYITSEVQYVISLGGTMGNDYPIAPTINDLAKSQAETEQGWSLA
jgi:hypothetical protein